MITNKIKRMKTNFYNFYTGFPPKMWKSQRTAFLTKTCIILLCLFLLVSCSYFKKTTRTQQPPTTPLLENSLISMNEENVRKKLGEPTIVSLTHENRILWTYIPEWKLMPDNKDTVYIEFENGKVIKVVKAKK
jgi:outer membrane protein assembly factor BamE (lipoprotein component of BamABCDE complex)